MPSSTQLHDMYAAQQDSPLFRIPRELRDNIYAYYAHDDEGSFYDYASGKLLYANETKHEDRSGLSQTCRAAANEMQDVALRTNTITFTPGLSYDDGREYRGLRSRAGRFECLLYYVCWTKMQMLHYVARGGCVTPEMLDQVAEKFPGVARYLRQAYQAILEGEELWHLRGADYGYRWQMPAAFYEAIQYTLELASTHAAFEHLVSKACPASDRIQGWRNYFVPGSHSTILAWKPQWWSIPSDADLSLEHLLTEDESDYRGRLDFAEDLAPNKWYFSATAVAIDYLRRLTREQRMQIDGKVIITEKFKGAAQPECHARGLIPYCIENPKVRVEMHVGIWTGLMPSIWLERNLYAHNPHCATIRSERLLAAFADWVDDVMSLSSLDMPAESLTVVLEGQRTLEVWEKLKHAAILQEAMAESSCFRRQEITYPQGGRLLHRFQLPCDLPGSFPRAIKQIAEGTSIIQLEGTLGGPYSATEFIHERRDWSQLKFFVEWRSFRGSPVKMPPGGVQAFFDIYSI